MFITPPTTPYSKALIITQWKKRVHSQLTGTIWEDQRQLMGMFQPPLYDTDALPGNNSFLFTLQALCPQGFQAMLL